MYYIVCSFDQLLTQEGPLNYPEISWAIFQEELDKCPLGPTLVKQLLGAEQTNFTKFMAKARHLFEHLYDGSSLLKQNSAQLMLLYQLIQEIYQEYNKVEFDKNCDREFRDNVNFLWLIKSLSQ